MASHIWVNNGACNDLFHTTPSGHYWTTINLKLMRCSDSQLSAVSQEITYLSKITTSSPRTQWVNVVKSEKDDIFCNISGRWRTHKTVQIRNCYFLIHRYLYSYSMSNDCNVLYINIYIYIYMCVHNVTPHWLIPCLSGNLRYIPTMTYLLFVLEPGTS